VQQADGDLQTTEQTSESIFSEPRDHAQQEGNAGKKGEEDRIPPWLARLGRTCDGATTPRNYITNLLSAGNHGIFQLDNVGCGGHPPCAHQVPLAGPATQFLAADHAHWERDHIGRFQLLCHRAAAVAGRDAMVSISTLPSCPCFC